MRRTAKPFYLEVIIGSLVVLEVVKHDAETLARVRHFRHLLHFGDFVLQEAGREVIVKPNFDLDQRSRI